MPSQKLKGNVDLSVQFFSIDQLDLFSIDYSPKFLEARALLAEMLHDLVCPDGKALAKQRTADKACR